MELAAVDRHLSRGKGVLLREAGCRPRLHIVKEHAAANDGEGSCAVARAVEHDLLFKGAAADPDARYILLPFVLAGVQTHRPLEGAAVDAHLAGVRRHQRIAAGAVEQIRVLLFKVHSVGMFLVLIGLRRNMERTAVDDDGSAGVAVDHALPSRIVHEAAGVHLQRSAVEGELSGGLYIKEVARVVVGRAEDSPLPAPGAVQNRQVAVPDHKHIAHGGFCGVHPQREAVQVKLLPAPDLQRRKDAHAAVQLAGVDVLHQPDIVCAALVTQRRLKLLVAVDAGPLDRARPHARVGHAGEQRGQCKRQKPCRKASEFSFFHFFLLLLEIVEY